MKNRTPEERRKHYRLNVERTVELTRYGNFSGSESASIENISESGALIRAEQLYEVGEKLVLMLHLEPPARPMCITAEVVRILHQSSYYMGVQFVSITSQDMDALIKFIAVEQRKGLSKKG